MKRKGNALKKGYRMKRFVTSIVLGLLILCPFVVHAAGSWATSSGNNIPNAPFKTLTLVFTADAANATVPNYSFTASDLAFVKGYWLIGVETDPGATAPTPLYDMYILDANGKDIMGTTLEDRSDTATQVAIPKWDGANYGFPPLDGTALTVTVSNNAVNSATVTLKIYLSR